MLSNNFLPSELMKVLLVPMNKNKKIISLDSRSYSPIALPTAASKVFELIFQNRMSPYIYTSDGTDMAEFSSKENVKTFLNPRSPVFVCFLDATKAFDRVNHTKLFNI